MPGPGSVGSRNDNSKCTAYKHNKCGKNTQMSGKPKTIECEIKVKKITNPNKDCIQNEKRNIFHILQRHHSFPNVKDNSFYFFKKRQRSHQIVKKYYYSNNAKQNDIEPYRCQQVNNGRNLSPGFFKESEKNRHL